MARFRISSHGRLQDWVAVEHGYFEEEGLDYEFDVRALENAAQDVAGDGQSDIRVGGIAVSVRWGREEEHELRVPLGGQSGRGGRYSCENCPRDRPGGTRPSPRTPQ